MVCGTNTEPQAETYRGVLRPREAQNLSYTFTPAFSPRATSRLTIEVTYLDPGGSEMRLPLRSTKVATQPRKDVVEIDFGGLDQLDDL